MKFPLNVTLTKLNTRDDAYIPQRDKYPDGYAKIGLMWEHSVPKVGESFVLYYDKLTSIFHTSLVQEITSELPGEIVFKTMNSTYKITYESSN